MVAAATAHNPFNHHPTIIQQLQVSYQHHIGRPSNSHGLGNSTNPRYIMMGKTKSASKISPPSLCGLNLGTTACNVAVRYESILSSFCFTLFVLKFSIGFSSAPSYNSITIPNSPSWRYDRKSTVYHPFRGQLRKRMHGTTTQRNICKVNHREKIIWGLPWL